MEESKLNSRAELVKSYSEYIEPLVGEGEFRDKLISGLQNLLSESTSEVPDVNEEIISRNSLKNFAIANGHNTHSLNGLVGRLKSKRLTCYKNIVSYHDEKSEYGGVLGISSVGPASFEILNKYLESKGSEKLL
jgi:hypothetical protein